MNKKVAVTVALLIGLASSHAQAGVLDWMRKWHVEVATGGVPEYEQTAKPIDVVAYVPAYNSKIVGTLHKDALHQVAIKDAIFIAEAPVAETGTFDFGLHASIFPARVGLSSTTLGGYAGWMHGRLKATAWVGLTNYKLSNYNVIASRGIEARAKASALSAGIGLRMNVLGPLVVETSLESTGSAECEDSQYYLYDQHVALPSEYTPPPVTFHANTTVRVGVGVNFSFLPSSANWSAEIQKRSEENVQHVIAPNIPAEYRPFTEALTESLIKYDSRAIVRFAAGNITWDYTKQALIIGVRSEREYIRNQDYTDWVSNRKSIDDAYPRFKSDWIDRYSAAVVKAIRSQQTKGLLAPTSIIISMDYVTYIQTSFSVKGGGINAVDQQTDLVTVELEVGKDAGTHVARIHTDIAI